MLLLSMFVVLYIVEREVITLYVMLAQMLYSLVLTAISLIPSSSSLHNWRLHQVLPLMKHICVHPRDSDFFTTFGNGLGVVLRDGIFETDTIVTDRLKCGKIACAIRNRIIQSLSAIFMGYQLDWPYILRAPVTAYGRSWDELHHPPA